MLPSVPPNVAGPPLAPDAPLDPEAPLEPDEDDDAAASEPEGVPPEDAAPPELEPEPESSWVSDEPPGPCGAVPQAAPTKTTLVRKATRINARLLFATRSWS